MKSVFIPKDNHGEILHAHGGQILVRKRYLLLDWRKQNTEE